ncbi:hypothetical protein KDD17_16435 [Sulfitobacter albidus]|uniref:MarR family transcriptional regulator n=1 Tax=Sulfitobacter albidus TaxID=2829501 RepID=A0A975PMI2_9RHOB|nr:hypothetical protein [Sulfitobacter albidus]QUJ76446.1 hypothetical protein KDD17_16435 [Sulfitobacter albidus]
MRRRSFLAGLGALAGSALVPFARVRAAAVAAPAIPPTARAWATLIVRAQGRSSPAMLARHLGLTPAQANALFSSLLREGVVQAPGAAGIARATAPLQTTGRTATRAAALRARLARAATATQALVKDAPVAQSPVEQDEDQTHAGTDQPLQESAR